MTVEADYAALSSATRRLVSLDRRGAPVIEDSVHQELIAISHRLGVADGKAPNTDEHAPRVVLPSEMVIEANREQMAELLADHVAGATRRCETTRLAELQHQVAPPMSRRAWVKHFGPILLIVFAVGTVEMAVGREWTQRVFGLVGGWVTVVAVALPVMVALAGWIMAGSVMQSRGGRVARTQSVLTALLWLSIATTFGVGALVMGKIVRRSTEGGGGFSGGGAPTAGGSGILVATSYNWVVGGAYFSLMLLGFLAVALMHLRELRREEAARVLAISARQDFLSDPCRVAKANLAFFDGFLNTHRSLMSLHRVMSATYVAGVLANLDDKDIADEWSKMQESGAIRDDPQWVTELRGRMAKLEEVCKG